MPTPRAMMLSSESEFLTIVVEVGLGIVVGTEFDGTGSPEVSSFVEIAFEIDGTGVVSVDRCTSRCDMSRLGIQVLVPVVVSQPKPVAVNPETT